MRRWWLIGLIALAIGGGWLARGADSAPLTMTDEERAVISQFRDEARELVREQSELSWKRRTTGEEVDIAATYAGHEKLFSFDTLLRLARAIAATDDPLEKKTYAYFYNYVLGEIVAARVATLDDQIVNYFATATFTFDDAEHAYYDYYRLIGDETDYAKRQAISDAVLPVLAEANELYQDKEARVQRLAKELGFADYVALSGRLRNVDLDRFAVVCRRFLDDTARLYRKQLRWAVPEQLGFPADRVRRADLSRLFKNVKYDAYFPKDGLMPRLDAFLAGLGLTKDKIKIDDADRPKKNPRAACFPIDVPQDVRLTIKPAGGLGDYEALWHEMGHAEHFANATVKQWEFQQLGDNVTTESYAFLFDGLIGNPRFVRRYLGMKGADLAGHVRFVAFTKLYMVRRYCAKVLYEIELHRGAADPRETYRRLLSEAYGFELNDGDAARYLDDVDDFFYSADYTRAWLVEAMLERRLTDEFGDEWFAEPAAGAYLQSLWAEGQIPSGDELLAKIGFAELTPKYLVKRIKQRAKTKP